MKFFAVFVAVLAVAAAAPRRAQLWDVNQLSEAIDSPNTDPALKPFLIDALNTLMDAIWNGSPITAIPVVTPVGVLEHAPVAPVAPVAPGSVSEAEVKPIAPAPVAEAASGKPLVQLIINVNAQAQEAASPVAPAGVIELAPMEVAEKPIPNRPVPVETIANRPVPVETIPNRPVPVATIPIRPVPVQTIPVNPVPGNPIDVVSVSEPDFNPVDAISPVPAVEAGSNVGILV